MAQVDEARYRIVVPYQGNMQQIQDAVQRYHAAKTAVWHRVTPKKKRAIETKLYVKSPFQVYLEGGILTIYMALVITPSGSVKPVEILALMAQQFRLPVDVNAALVTRIGLFSGGKAVIDK